MATRRPTAEICAAVVELGDSVEAEIVDKARLIYRSRVNEYLLAREEANTLASARENIAIDSAMAMAAIDRQWEAVNVLSTEIAGELKNLLADSDAEARIKILNWCNNNQNTLASTTQKLVQAHILMTRAEIEIPYRAVQLSGDRLITRNEITPEFLKEIEGMLGILPYDEDFEAVAIADSSETTTT